MPNRAIKDERDRGRPKVGPADSATVARELAKRLNEREPNRYGKGEPKRSAKPKVKADVSIGGAMKAIKDRKYRDRKYIDEAG